MDGVARHCIDNIFISCDYDSLLTIFMTCFQLSCLKNIKSCNHPCWSKERVSWLDKVKSYFTETSCYIRFKNTTNQRCLFPCFCFICKALCILLFREVAETDSHQYSYSEEVCQHVVKRKNNTFINKLACWNNTNLARTQRNCGDAAEINQVNCWCGYNFLWSIFAASVSRNRSIDGNRSQHVCSLYCIIIKLKTMES